MLVADLLDTYMRDGHGPRPPSRSAAAALWSVENNLNIADVDREEFVGAADADGVFRGFEPRD